MDKVLAEKELGADGDLKLELKAGKLLLSISYLASGVNGSVSVELSSDYFIDKLAEVIPGEIDDAILAILKSALKV